MINKPLFADVILPLSLAGNYTYRVPDELCSLVREGMRVEVQFGKKRIYTAIVKKLHHQAPVAEAKMVLSLLDEKQVVTALQLQFWNWISDYYMCTTGEVMSAALPAGLKPESESRICANPDFSDWLSLNRQEQLIMDVIGSTGEITIGKLAASGSEKGLMQMIRSLVEKEAIVLNEVFEKRIKTVTINHVKLGGEWHNENKLSELLDSLSRAPKQLEVLERFLDLSDQFSENEVPSLSRAVLMDGFPATALSSLVKKGIFEIIRVEKGDKEKLKEEPVPPKTLNTQQSTALSEIKQLFEKMQTVLLYGVTSSGKTEVYIHLIREMIKAGKQTLYLLPEIALTTQIIERLKSVFGTRVGIYHSRFSDSERVRVYRNLAGLTSEEPYKVILGVRSAVFLPFNNLGLVIVDEEHESTFKQFDPAPRYHARDSVNILALFHNAKVLLGSATPSFESWYNARTGKYGMVKLESRFGNASLPEIILADTRKATRKKQMHSLFSPRLLTEIEETFKAGKQVILFQNRRGYSNYLWCPDCSHIPRCSRCDVSLTYHRQRNELVCHYCGKNEKVPSRCPDCGNPKMVMKGFGTEKVEDELSLMVPGIRVGRLDTDVARSRNSYEKILNDFSARQLDVLVGTQIVTKGLDFGNVLLVGILDADSMLNFPDFRAFERSFQLMMQVSGRAGRREEKGTVIIQTGNPLHPVIQYVVHQDFEKMFSEQMEERKIFAYPPYTRMIRLTLKHKVPSFVDNAALHLAKALKDTFGIRVLGPQPPSAGRRYGLYHQEIIIKIERSASFERARNLVAENINGLENSPVHKAVKVIIDIDPY